MKLKFFLIAITLLQTSVALADLKVIINDAEEGGTSTITSNYKMARMDSGSDPTYMIVDLNKNLFTTVDPRNKVAMLLNTGNSNPTSNKNSINVKLKNMGNGPVISGFHTKKYILSANGQKCETIYGSQEAMKIKGLKEIFSSLVSLTQETSDMIGEYGQMLDTCSQIKLESLKSYTTTGIPIRILNNMDVMVSEVKSIDTKANVATNNYQIPADYKKTSMKQQIEQSKQAIKKMQQQMPEINKMLEKMQQQGGGEPSSDMMEQMKNLFKQ